jgi:hypothetical protein
MPLACRIGLVAVGFDAQKISLVQMGLDDADDDKTASELDAMIIENSITKTCELNKLQLKVCDIVRQCIQDVAASSVCKFIAGVLRGLIAASGRGRAGQWLQRRREV